MATSQFSIKVTGIGELEKAEQAIDAGAGSVNNLRSQLKDLERELASLDPSSDKFVELSSQAGQLRDQLKNVKESVNANAAPAFERLGNNATLLTQKLSTLDFGGAAESVKLLAANVGQVSFKELGSELTSFGKSLGQLGKALLTNPIFLLAAAIAAIVMNFETLTKVVPGVNEALTGVSDEMTKQLELSKERVALAESELEKASNIEKQMRLQGASEKEILLFRQERIKALLQELKTQLDQQKIIADAQIQTAARNKEILSGIIQFLTAPLQALLFTVDEIGEAFGKNFGLREGFNDFTSSLIFDPEETKKASEEAQKAIEDRIRQTEGQLLDGEIAIKNINKQAADEARKTREEENKKRIEEERKLLAARFKLQQDFNAAVKENEEKRRQAELQAEAERLRIASEQAEVRKQLTVLTPIQEEIAAVDAKYIKLREMANGDAELIRQITEANIAEVAKIEEKAAQDAIARESAVQQAKIDFASGALSTISEVVSSFAGESEKSAKRAFELNKGIAIAQTIIETYKGAQAIFASAAANPASILFPAQPFIAAGLAITAGLARVNNIRKQKFDGGGGTGGAGGGGGVPSFGGGGAAASTPQFNALNPNFLNREQNNSQPPVRAYVLASNVTTAQAAQEKINDQSTL